MLIYFRFLIKNCYVRDVSLLNLAKFETNIKFFNQIWPKNAKISKKIC